MTVSFTVPGCPVPQGSARAILIADQPRVIHSNANGIRAWRARAKREASAVMAGRFPFNTAVAVEVVFYLPRPATLKRAHPSVRPDLDKLQRALGDALQGTVVVDDARIVRWSATKAYGEPRTEVRVEVVA